MSDATADRDPFEVLAESFLARYRAGERPSIEELAAGHPELAGPIRKLLPALVRVERDLSVDEGSAIPVMPAVPGAERRIGDYRILREIGRGGMGLVYEAEQISLGRRVALKVLPGHVTGDRVALERFRREAKAAARLHHTNIVPVFEVGRDASSPSTPCSSSRARGSTRSSTSCGGFEIPVGGRVPTAMPGPRATLRPRPPLRPGWRYRPV